MVDVCNFGRLLGIEQKIAFAHIEAQIVTLTCKNVCRYASRKRLNINQAMRLYTVVQKFTLAK